VRETFGDSPLCFTFADSLLTRLSPKVSLFFTFADSLLTRLSPKVSLLFTLGDKRETPLVKREKDLPLK
jgi:hypothetical protein